MLYQEGTLDAMLPVKDLIERGFGGMGLSDGCAMFGGTFAAKGGIRPAVSLRIRAGRSGAEAQDQPRRMT